MNPDKKFNVKKEDSSEIKKTEGKNELKKKPKRESIYLNSKLSKIVNDLSTKYNVSKSKLFRDAIKIFLNRALDLIELKKEYDYESVLKSIDNALDSYIKKELITHSEILRYYSPQISFIRGCTESVIESIKESFKLFKNEYTYEKYKEIVDKWLLDLNDSLMTQKNFTKNLFSYFEEPPPIVINSTKYDILLIDDDKNMTKLISDFFKNRKGTVKCLKNVVEAALLLKRSKPKVLLLDIGLPDIDGIDFCLRLKQNKNYKDVAVIFLTAQIVKEWELGDFLKKTKADAIISKPFELTDLSIVYKYL